MNDLRTSASISAETVPLPTLDISSPEAAQKSAVLFFEWIRQSAVDLPPEAYLLAQYVEKGIEVLAFKPAHESPALKQFVQDAIDKLRAMLDQPTS